MPRKFLILAAAIVGLHLLETAALGTSTNGSFLANLLQVLACGFAAVMAFGASRRGRGLSRPFWLLVGMGISMWGLANLGWMYYEVVLHNEPPQVSVVRFLFGFEAVLIALALFLDQDKDSPRIGVETALDFVQIGIVFFFIFLEFYFLPARQLDKHSAFLREMRVENLEDVMVVALAGFRALTARKPHLRKLYGGLTLYFLVVTVFAAAGRSTATSSWERQRWRSICKAFGQLQPGRCAICFGRCRFSRARYGPLNGNRTRWKEADRRHATKR